MQMVQAVLCENNSWHTSSNKAEVCVLLCPPPEWHKRSHMKPTAKNFHKLRGVGENQSSEQRDRSFRWCVVVVIMSSGAKLHIGVERGDELWAAPRHIA